LEHHAERDDYSEEWMPMIQCAVAPSIHDKIKEIDELGDILAGVRGGGQKVVHCHGVFDPLHIGHIRHFEQAKKLGDILIVTVTPDRFVNKGPHRPIFTERLRAEAIAALECVDFVAVNQWPMAIEAIRLLRPDLYIKGCEFRERKDLTGAIELEERAVRAVGGQLAFTGDITFSSSHLVNRHFPVFPREVTDYLAGFAAKYPISTVLRYLEGARDLKVLVVGEAIIDEYQYCEAIGKSREPSLAVKYHSSEKFAGGALALANHVANFSDQVTLLTMLGTQSDQEAFIHEKLNSNIEKRFVYRNNSPTIVKRRFVETYYFTKLFEVYDINDRKLEEADNEKLCQALRGRLAEYDLVIISDFGHGMLGREAVSILCREARFLAVSTQSSAGNIGYHAISRYPRADYVCLAEPEVRLDARDRRGKLRAMIRRLARRLGCQKMVVTRGKRGCLGYSHEGEFAAVPAFAGPVVDRTGAGDAFLALTAPCVVQDAPMEIVGFIGNVVGAEAVASVGHRHLIERVPLCRHIEHLLK
jgi:rfaE bifunctional protein nucleotidyltransferase chain/domain